MTQTALHNLHSLKHQLEMEEISYVVTMSNWLVTCVYPQDGWTALHLAAQGGKIDVIKLLIEAEAYVNMQSKVYTYTIIILYIYTLYIHAL